MRAVIDARHIFLVPPCDAEPDGELSVVGVRQARSLGDALGDVSLWAAYAAPGLAYEETREYVRRVFAARRAYRTTYAQELGI